MAEYGIPFADFSAVVVVDIFALFGDDYRLKLGGCVVFRHSRKVRQAMRYIAKERITLNPDCGFAPGSGAVVPIDEAYKKLQNEAKAAEILRQEF